MDHCFRKNKSTFARVGVALMIMLPVLALFSLIQNADPNLEVWLAKKTEGYFRPDAFEGVARIMPTFMAVFGGTSVLAACLVIFQQEKYVFLLLVGPAFGTVVYLLNYGFTDPAWFSLLALLSIGMLVGSPVITIWVFVNWNRNQNNPSVGPPACL